MINTNLDPLTVIAMAWAVAVTVFWMFIGFRAMKAHERIAGALERQSNQPE